MKKILNAILFSAVLGAIALDVSSCKKDENTNPSSSNNNSNVSSSSLAVGKSKIKATVSGAQSTNYESTDMASTATSSGGILLITTSNISTNLNVDQFIITLPADVTTGTYKASDFSDRTGGIFTFSRAEGGSVTGGWQADPEGETVFNFTITKATGSEIEGTFDGEMSNDNDDTKVKAVGSFAAKY